jgi:hypothetical protein
MFRTFIVFRQLRKSDDLLVCQYDDSHKPFPLPRMQLSVICERVNGRKSKEL